MTKLLVALISALLTTSAIAGLVEINSSQYIRESGSPSPQTLEVSLENEGEIRVSNINLQDADSELSDSTQIYLNGSAILSPFQVPYGGYVVFPLSAGTHYLEVTLRGQPGGGLEVAFYENKPDAPVQGKGWELLNDGTVLHRKTGLIWHRNAATPGPAAYASVCPDELSRCNITISEYISNLNAGVYGRDSVYGNAGFSDWRAPSAMELFETIDIRVTSPPLTDKNGDVSYSLETEEGATRGGWRGGMQFGDPLFVCNNDLAPKWGEAPTDCPPEFYAGAWITNDRYPSYWYNENLSYLSVTVGQSQGQFEPWYNTGSVWPVRGEIRQ